MRWLSSENGASDRLRNPVVRSVVEVERQTSAIGFEFCWLVKKVLIPQTSKRHVEPRVRVLPAALPIERQRKPSLIT